MADGVGAGGIAPQGDVVRIAAEGRDVFTHPFHRHPLVQNVKIVAVPVFALRIQGRQVQAGQHPQPVIDRHQHDFRMLANELLPVVNGRARVALQIVAAVDPDHHRLRRRACIRGPYVQVQAVLAARFQLKAIDMPVRFIRHLHRGVPGIERLVHLIDVRLLDGRLPAPVSHGGLRVRNAPEHPDSGVENPADKPARLAGNHFCRTHQIITPDSQS